MTNHTAAPQVPPCRRRRWPAAVAWLLVAAACTSFQPATFADIAPETRVRLSFGTAVSVPGELRTARGYPTRCRMTALDGRITAVRGDTLLLRDLSTLRLAAGESSRCLALTTATVVREPGTSLTVATRQRDTQRDSAALLIVLMAIGGLVMLISTLTLF